MDLIKLKELISKIPAPYQDVEIDGQLLARGMRVTCVKRWEFLKPHLKDNKVIMVVGSDLGYFTSRIAEQFPASLVLSFEQNENACQVQKEILRLKNLYNIVLCQHKFWLADFKRLLKQPEAIDTIIFLAVLHHYEADEEREALKLLSKMIPEIIIEYVVQTGPGAWGGKAYLDFEKELLEWYEHIEILGVSSLGPAEKRIIIKAWNDKIVRENLSGSGVHKLEYFYYKWSLSSKNQSNSQLYNISHENFITAFNALNVLHFNPIWPESEWWQKQAVEVYEKLIRNGLEPTNIHTANLLMTPTGLKAIEYNSPSNPFNLTKTQQDIARVKHTFELMKPLF